MVNLDATVSTYLLGESSDLATCGREAGQAGSNLAGAACETGISKEGESKLRNLSRCARGSGPQGCRVKANSKGPRGSSCWTPASDSREEWWKSKREWWS